MTNITISVDDDVKKEAEILFENLGMSISGAINIFFRQAIRDQALPFEVKVSNKYDEYFNPYNMKILEESIAELEAGHGITKTMAELEVMEIE